MSAPLVLPPLGPAWDLHPELGAAERRRRARPPGERVDLERGEAHPVDHFAALLRTAADDALPALEPGPLARDLLARVHTRALVRGDVLVAGRARRLLAALAATAPDAGVAQIALQGWARGWEPPRGAEGSLSLRRVASLEDAGRLLAEVRADPWRWRCAGLLPWFESARESEVGVLPDWASGLLLHDADGPARALARSLIRLLHPERLQRYLYLEHAALSGADVQADRLALRGASSLATADAARCASAARRPPVARGGVPEPLDGLPPVVAVCGIDGAGKSRHVQALAEHAACRGWRPGCFKLFRHGVFHETVTELTRLCSGDRHLDLWRLQREIKLLDSALALRTLVLPGAADHDVLLFDRSMPTHHAAAAGRLLHTGPCDALAALLPRARLNVLLDLPVPAAEARLDARAARTVDEHAYMLGRYRDGLRDQARGDDWVVLDATRPFEENRLALAAAFDVALGPAPGHDLSRPHAAARAAGRATSASPGPPGPSEPSGAAQAQPSGGPGRLELRVSLDPADGDELCGAASEWGVVLPELVEALHGGRLSPVTLLELQAAQLVERCRELAAGGPGSAVVRRVPIWPAALAQACLLPLARHRLLLSLLPPLTLVVAVPEPRALEAWVSEHLGLAGFDASLYAARFAGLAGREGVPTPWGGRP